MENDADEVVFTTALPMEAWALPVAASCFALCGQGARQANRKHCTVVKEAHPGNSEASCNSRNCSRLAIYD